MKIGIITWFQTSNYGTNLQAIALQQSLRNVGHDVQIINFKVTSGRRESKRSFGEKMLRQPQKYANKYAFHKYATSIKKRNQAFNTIINERSILTKTIFTEQDYIDVCNTFELLICGSDQIWNPNWYHKFYYADFAEIFARRISYAPSLGVSEIPENLKDTIRKSLSRFEEISVREEKGADLLEPLFMERPQVVVDPTFLLTQSEWGEMAERGIHVSGNYILCMFLTDNRRHWKAAKKFAKDMGIPLKIVPYLGFSYFQKGTIYPEAGIEDLLSLIQGARYVLTDSFHITVFSLIFKRQFWVFKRFKDNNYTSQNSRIENLLRMTKLEKRLVDYSSSEVPQIEEIDYKNIDMILQSEISKSKQFLFRAIEGKKEGGRYGDCL